MKNQTVGRRGWGVGGGLLPPNHICALYAAVEAVLCNLNVCFLQYTPFLQHEIYRRTRLDKMGSLTRCHPVRSPHAMATIG